MNDGYKILLVDDEPDILEFLKYNLEKEGYLVETAANGAEGIKRAKSFKPHLIILDIMLPVMDGVEACSELRSMPEFNDTIIVFLSGRNEDYSQIAGFETGADDYITKPIRPRVFVARIKALLSRRRLGLNEKPQVNLKFGEIEINLDGRTVTREGREINLAKKEFQLLILFTSQPGKIFQREEIYTRVWGNDLVVGDRTLDVHIRKLREKIGDSFIRTSKGIGYGINV